MTDISHSLKIEGPGAREPRESAGVLVEYMGVRIIIAAQSRTPRDRGVMVMVQTEDGGEDILEFEVKAGVTIMPVCVDLEGLLA